MSVIFNPDVRELELEPLDYDAFCLIRDAALAIRERTEVISDPKIAGVNFRAIDMSTKLPDPAYAALCQDVHVVSSKFGSREKLVINMEERALGSDSTRSPYFYRQIGIRARNGFVCRSWRTTYFPWALQPIAHEHVEETEHQVQSFMGALTLHDIVASHPLVLGDAEHIVRELDEFAQGS